MTTVVTWSPMQVVKATRLGDEVRRMREELGLTQAEVADRMGMSSSTVGDIETGRILRPPDECLTALAEALGTTRGHLLDLIPDERKNMTIYVKATRLGDWLRNRREEMGLSLDDVARQLPITGSTLGQIERGEIFRPPDDVLEALADALDTSMTQLLGLIPDEIQAAYSFDQLASLVAELAMVQQQVTTRLQTLRNQVSLL